MIGKGDAAIPSAMAAIWGVTPHLPCSPIVPSGSWVVDLFRSVPPRDCRLQRPMKRHRMSCREGATSLCAAEAPVASPRRLRGRAMVIATGRGSCPRPSWAPQGQSPARSARRQTSVIASKDVERRTSDSVLHANACGRTVYRYAIAVLAFGDDDHRAVVGSCRDTDFAATRGSDRNGPTEPIGLPTIGRDDGTDRSVGRACCRADPDGHRLAINPVPCAGRKRTNLA